MEIEPRVRRNQGGHQETSAFSLLLLFSFLPKAAVGLTLRGQGDLGDAIYRG